MLHAGDRIFVACPRNVNVGGNRTFLVRASYLEIYNEEWLGADWLVGAGCESPLHTLLVMGKGRFGEGGGAGFDAFCWHVHPKTWLLPSRQSSTPQSVKLPEHALAVSPAAKDP